MLLHIFLETDTFFFFNYFSGFFNEWKVQKGQHLFDIEIFCNIINVLTVTFDQFNASLLNKVLINFFLYFFFLSY